MNTKILIYTLFTTILLQLIHTGLANPSGFTTPIDKSPYFTLENLPPDDISNKSELFPLSTKEIIGLVIIVTIAGLANAGGIGGGTLLTSILIMFFYYNENTALTVVYSLVFGGSLGNFINVARRRDKKTGKPLIDFDLSLICMPTMVLGTNIGVLMGRIAAPVVILIGIIAITIFTSTKILKKTKKQYAQETSEIENREHTVALKGHSDDVEWRERWVESFQSSEEGADPKLQKILHEDHQLLPPKKLGILIGLLLVIMIFSILRGTNKLKSPVGVEYCGAGYWSIYFLGLVICAIVLGINQKLVRSHIRIKREHDIETNADGFQVSSKNIPKLTLLSAIAGVLAGLLGIGGGMVMNPTLLSLGIPAQNLAATTGFFVVQTSFISLFQATLYGDVPLKEMTFFFAVSLVGSFGVSYFLSWLVKKYRRPSLVLIALLIVLALSLVATPTFEIWENWGNMGHLVEFNPIC